MGFSLHALKLRAEARFEFKEKLEASIAEFDLDIIADETYYTTSYNLLNAKAGIQRKILKHFEIDAFFGVNNITGVQYPFMVFVNQLPDAYLPAPLEANYFGGVNVKYNF